MMKVESQWSTPFVTFPRDLGVGFCQLAHGHLVGNDP